MSENDFEFFYGGTFSQWSYSKFKIGNQTYTCAEQYMMAQKALTFGDIEAQIKIMCTGDPSKQKSIGRRVKNFNALHWNTVCKKIVYDGNYAKFTQNENLKTVLLSTGEKELVEASPTDIIWGIGLSQTDPKRLDKGQWRGTNWLGEVLVAVRNDIRKL